MDVSQLGGARLTLGNGKQPTPSSTGRGGGATIPPLPKLS
jgi:hypothetical protein